MKEGEVMRAVTDYIAAPPAQYHRLEREKLEAVAALTAMSRGTPLRSYAPPVLSAVTGPSATPLTPMTRERVQQCHAAFAHLGSPMEIVVGMQVTDESLRQGFIEASRTARERWKTFDVVPLFELYAADTKVVADAVKPGVQTLILEKKIVKPQVPSDAIVFVTTVIVPSGRIVWGVENCYVFGAESASMLSGLDDTVFPAFRSFALRLRL